MIEFFFLVGLVLSIFSFSLIDAQILELTYSPP